MAAWSGTPYNAAVDRRQQRQQQRWQERRQRRQQSGSSSGISIISLTEHGAWTRAKRHTTHVQCSGPALREKGGTAAAAEAAEAAAAVATCGGVGETLTKAAAAMAAATWRGALLRFRS